MATHCSSYYADSMNQQLQFPVLEGELKVDVCVVGAGFTGVSSALSLAERGYKVAVVEQHRVGWGASGRNGGQLIGGFSGSGKLLKQYGEGFSEELFRLGYRGHEIIEERVNKYGIDCDLKYGFIDVAFKNRHIKSLHEWVEDLSKHGMAEHLRMVEATEMREFLGTDAYVGGLVNTRNGHLHPLNLCLGEAKAAADLGVLFFENTEVEEIKHGDSPVVRTGKGSINADFVVMAGNAYQQLDLKNLAGKIFPAGSYIIATEPLSEEEAAEINPQDMAICDMNEVLDYHRLSADRRMLFGGRCNYSGRAPKSIKATMAPRMRKIFPQLANKKIDYEWGGNVGIVVNRVPLIGRASKNVFYSVGYSGHGVGVTHLAGEIMAEAVSGTFETMDIFSKVKHTPIPLGRTFGGYMVALGMLYYRIMDLR